MPVESTRATARGGQLAETVTISFRVADPPPLFVAGIEPGLSTTGFALDGAMQVRFSEPPALALAADCTGRGFGPAALIVVEETYDAHPRLAGLTSPRAVTGAYACTVPAAGAEGPAACADDPAADPCTVTFTPDSPFEYSSQVSVVVAGVTLTPGLTPSAIDGLESIRATTYGGQLEADVSSSSRTLDPPPLAVIGSSPAAGAAMAPLDSSVEVTFSEGVLCDSISGATVTLVEELDPHPHYGGGAGITVTHTYALTCVDGDAVVLFNPDIELQYSSRVTLTLAGGAYPGAVESVRATTLGGQLAQSVALSFRAYDPPALAITGTWPSPGAVGVNVASPISVTFAEEVDCAGVSDTSFAVSELTDGGTTIDHTCAFTCAGGVVTCDPSQDFGLTSIVTVTLDQTLESARASSRGGQLTSGFTFSFDTMHPPPLIVASAQPGDGNTNVNVGTLVTVGFSEDVDCTTIDDTSFIVESCDQDTTCLSGTYTAVPGLFGCSVGSAVITFDADPDLAYDAEVRVSLTQAIASARATSHGGQLAQPMTWSFETIPVPPIEVVSHTPEDEQQNVPTTSIIEVVFNVDVLESTLSTAFEPAGCDPAADCVASPATCCTARPNVWVVAEGDPVTAHVPMTLASYAAATRTAVFAPTLVGGVRYEVRIRGDITGVRTQEGSMLLADYLWQFFAGVSQFVGRTLPADLAADVAVSTPVCAVFYQDAETATIDAGTFSMTFTDRFGRTVGVPAASYTFEGVNPNTGAPSASFSTNKVCMIPDPTLFNCLPDQRTLLYNTEYRVALTSGISFTPSGDTLTGGFAWSFTTGDPPLIAGVFAENAIVTVDPLRDAEEVPVSSELVIELAAPMDPATVDDSTVLLEDSVGPVVAGVVLSADGLTARVTPNVMLAYDDLHTLTLVSGLSGVLTIGGEWLDADYTLSFRTSPATSVEISPPQGENGVSSASCPVTFSRPMYLPSVSTNSLYAHDNSDGRRLSAIVALNAADVDSAILVPVPALVDGHSVTVNVTTAAMDYLGNPLPADTSVTYDSVASAPALNARTPGTIGAGALVPAAGTVSGDQAFVLTLPAPGAHLENRMLPPTFNDDTIIISDDDDCHGGGAGAALGQSNTYDIGAAGQPDRVTFRAAALPVVVTFSEAVAPATLTADTEAADGGVRLTCQDVVTSF